MSGPFGWGLVGLGIHAERYVAPAMRSSSTGALVAVCGRDLERTRAFAHRHGALAAYDSLAALLDNPSVQGVFICTPNYVHLEQVVASAAAGKAVLCEKPLAESATSASTIVEACRVRPTPLGVGFHLRHNPAHLHLQELVCSGGIGSLEFIEVEYLHVSSGDHQPGAIANWRSDPALAGGRGFVGTGVHAVDLLRFLTGEEVQGVVAAADAGWDATGSERTVQATFRLSSGAVGVVRAGRTPYPVNGITIYGSAGAIRATGSVGNRGGGMIQLWGASGRTVREFPTVDVYERELDAFVAGVSAGTEPNASGYDGLRAAEITEAVYKSMQSRQTVKLASSAV